jgi:hypothetical protein
MTLGPFLLWNLYKYQWHLSNDLEIGAIQSFERIISRLTDGSYKTIFQYSFQQIKDALLLLGLLYLASNIRYKSLVKESVPALMAAIIYYFGMISIYVSTPYDLIWHLNTSINRTMLPVNGCIYVGCYFLLKKIENHEFTINKPLSSLSVK